MSDSNKNGCKARYSKGRVRDPLKVDLFVESAARPRVTLGQASIAAGYTDKPTSASVIGYRLMRDPAVRERVEKRRRELWQELWEEAEKPGWLLLVYAASVRLHRLAFVEAASVEEALAQLRAESPVGLALVWSARGARPLLARLRAQVECRLHHGQWYVLQRNDVLDFVDRAAELVRKDEGEPAPVS